MSIYIDCTDELRAVIADGGYDCFEELSDDTPSLSDEYKHIISDIVEAAIAFVKCPYECEVSVTITSDEDIHSINLEQRGIDRPTDVLSFPMVDYDTPADFSIVESDPFSYVNPETDELVLGDIIISIETAKRQSAEYGHSLKREVAFLTAHSMLHLFGYDHMDDDERLVMEQYQEQILTTKGYTRDYE